MTEQIIKVMKLSSGEEIVSEVLTEDNPKSFNVRCPLKLMSIPRLESSGIEESISLQRWIHFAEEKDVSIPKAQVLAVAKASIGLSKFYEYCVYKLDHHPLKDDEYVPEEELWEDEDEYLDELDDMESPSKLIH